jgi:hypothetical protein
MLRYVDTVLMTDFRVYQSLLLYLQYDYQFYTTLVDSSYFENKFSTYFGIEISLKKSCAI